VHRYLYLVIFTGGKIGLLDMIERPTAVEQYGHANCGRERNLRYSETIAQRHFAFSLNPKFPAVQRLYSPSVLAPAALEKCPADSQPKNGSAPSAGRNSRHGDPGIVRPRIRFVLWGADNLI
jgi:hypothetical protein